ncbi:MAG: ATP-binding cassette domain-containing protein, partial [Candidatus Diapherotrites archaeon]|nr:ATP-binding cassette domain-containing protein [Candidatus Diapherotrites archaeon]
TTFVKMLAGVLEADSGKVDWKTKIAYKPQYISAEKGVTVAELFMRKNIDRPFYESEIKKYLEIHKLEEKLLENLSGGELQKISIAYNLVQQDVGLILLDEPSAYLDVEQRLAVSHVIKQIAEKKKIVILVVDHDILFQDYVSNRLMVFEGEPGEKGFAGKAVSKREGMNKFLSQLGITFRRDPNTGRPRSNKTGSVLDEEQKKVGEYYYYTSG